MCVRENGSTCVSDVSERVEASVGLVKLCVVCANVYCKVSETKNKVPSLSRIGGRFIPTRFRPTDPLKSEGSYPGEHSDPGGNVSPVLLDYSLGANSKKAVT